MKTVDIIIRAMTWEEHERFIDEVEVHQPDTECEEFKNKSILERNLLIGKFNRRQAKWIFDNIYPNNDINKFTITEIILIAQKTIVANLQVRNEELKNLFPSSPGQEGVGKYVEPAQKSMPEHEKSLIATPAQTNTQTCSPETGDS